MDAARVIEHRIGGLQPALFEGSEIGGAGGLGCRAQGGGEEKGLEHGGVPGWLDKIPNGNFIAP
jgi:hypothetical protein